MSEAISLTSGVAGRYATALFTVFRDEKKLTLLEKDLAKLFDLAEKSEDFCAFLQSPMYTREQQENAIKALAQHMKLFKHTKNLLCLLARKGRLFIFEELAGQVKALIENERDEMGVEVVAAGTLTNAQIQQIESTVTKLLKKKIKVKVSVDNSLIGGMIVKLGSKMIDTTTKSKLAKLQSLMKEVS